MTSCGSALVCALANEIPQLTGVLTDHIESHANEVLGHVVLTEFTQHMASRISDDPGSFGEYIRWLERAYVAGCYEERSMILLSGVEPLGDAVGIAELARGMVGDFFEEQLAVGRAPHETGRQHDIPRTEWATCASEAGQAEYTQDLEPPEVDHLAQRYFTDLVRRWQTGALSLIDLHNNAHSPVQELCTGGDRELTQQIDQLLEQLFVTFTGDATIPRIVNIADHPGGQELLTEITHWMACLDAHRHAATVDLVEAFRGGSSAAKPDCPTGDAAPQHLSCAPSGLPGPATPSQVMLCGAVAYDCRPLRPVFHRHALTNFGELVPADLMAAYAAWVVDNIRAQPRDSSQVLYWMQRAFTTGNDSQQSLIANHFMPGLACSGDDEDLIRRHLKGPLQRLLATPKF